MGARSGARSGVRWIWLSRADEAERRIGTEKLKDRIQRQTIKRRRSPEDAVPRFFNVIFSV